jgi:hypothetical protein
MEQESSVAHIWADLQAVGLYHNSGSINLRLKKKKDKRHAAASAYLSGREVKDDFGAWSRSDPIILSNSNLGTTMKKRVR